jgi:hypothetical protein
MGPEILLPCSQEPTTRPYAELYELSPYPPMFCIVPLNLTINFKLNLDLVLLLRN